MLLDLTRFRGGIERVERQVPPSVLVQEGDDFRILTPTEFTADVRKDKEKVRLVGRVRTTLEVDCSRCLEPFEVKVDAPLDIIFLPVSANVGLPEGEVQEEDIGVSFYKDDVIDLSDVMREQFHLALPMKPLCQEDCRGLCPVCGINRNRETCNCQSSWVDPRFEALRSLKEK